MALSLYASGTQPATIGTEHLLSDVVAIGSYTLHLDSSAMIAGDTVEIRLSQRVLAGGTTRLVHLETLTDDQTLPVWVSIPMSNDLLESNSLRFTLKQTAGVGRAFPWKLLRHA